MDKTVKSDKFWCFDKEQEGGVWLIHNGLCIILFNFQYKHRSSFSSKILSTNKALAVIDFYEYT